MASGEIRVFYSWQSDLPGNATRSFILNCLKAAKKELESSAGPISSVIIDEATRDTTGAPHIPDTILQKIEKSDVLVADVSIINGKPPEDEKSEEGKTRKTPNPNVMVELGFGVGRLGWERAILVFNRSFGRFPDDLPFDINHRRVTPFALGVSEDDKAKEAVKKQLAGTLRDAISAIAKANPLRPRGEWAATTTRNRDIRALTNLCSQVDLSAVQLQCEDATRGFVSDVVLFYWAGASAVVADIDFHLHDDKTKKLVRELLRSWHQATPDTRFTEGVKHGYKFKPIDAVMNSTEEKAWKRLQAGAAQLSKALPAFVQHVQNHFVEIDLVETSRKARLQWTKA